MANLLTPSDDLNLRNAKLFYGLSNNPQMDKDFNLTRSINHWPEFAIFGILKNKKCENQIITVAIVF